MQACIDSGATLCLMSREAYNRIQHVVEPLRPTKRKASGASGKRLKIDGWLNIPFQIGGSTYSHSFLVGDLSGIDCLLGLDWLQSVGAVIDFSSMKAEFGPTEKVSLSTEPAEINYCRVPQGRTLMARAHTKVDCKCDWPGESQPMLFEPTCISLGPKVTIASGIVQPDSEGCFTITIQNDDNIDVELPDDVLIGLVSEIDRTHPADGRNATDPQEDQEFCIWRVAEHRLSPSSDTEDLLSAANGMETVLTAKSLVTDGEDGLAGSYSIPDKPPRRLVRQVRRSPRTRAGPGTSRLPTGVKVYDIHGKEVVDEDDDYVFYDLTPGTKNKHVFHSSSGERRQSSAHSPNHVPKRSSGRCTSRRWSEEEQRLPEHLRCVLPPAGNLTDSQLKIVIDLLLEFQDVFVGPDGKVGRTTLLQHSIDTSDAEPFKCHPRKKSPMEREHIAKEVQQLMEDGFIRPSMSPWGSPVVLARKKDGTLRFCIDYRALNKVTKKDAYPLPRIEECLDSLHGMMYYCTMDMAKGYWQVPMDPESIEKTAFSTHVGLFEWNVLPFGLCNAPATFCRLMEMVLADIVWKHCLVYLDDVIAFGKTFEDTLTSLREVFIRFRAHNLKLKASKCEFFRQSVEYLGHEVGVDGMRPSLSKVQALHDWKIPTDLTEVRSFLGFTSFYRRYIKNYSELAKPLTELTKGGKARPWVPLGDEQIQAFKGLIAALSERVMLHHVVDGNDFYLTTDASNYAIGASLEQETEDKVRVPIAFASKTLPESRVHYCATKKELYAIVYFMRYFVGFYRGHTVHIETDHYALQWLWRFIDPVDSMYFRWITEMTNYQPFTITYLPGSKNLVADALSRKNKPEHLGVPKRDCKIVGCEICEYHFRKDAKCRDSDSPDDSGIEGLASLKARCIASNTSFGEPPDEGDYASWDLMLIRSNDSPLLVYAFAQQQEWTAGEVEAIRQVDPPRRSARLEAKRQRQEALPTSTPSGTDNLRSKSYPEVGSGTHPNAGAKRRLRRKTSVCAGTKSPVPGGIQTSDTDSDNGYMDPEPSSTSAGEKSDSAITSPETSNHSDVIGEKELEQESMIKLESILTQYTVTDWIEAQKRDLVISRVMELLSSKVRPSREATKAESPAVQCMLRDWDSYEYDRGILCRRILRLKHATCDPGTLQRIVPLKWQKQLWMQMHGLDCRHLAYDKVYDLLCRNYAWYNMSEDIMDWGRACLTCQKSKPGIRAGIEPLVQEFTSHRNERVAIDLVGVLPTTQMGNRFIMVMQDYYTKFVELAALLDKSSTTVAQAMVNSWLCRWGCPESLHSDQGNEFDAAVFRELCGLFGIRKTRTTPFNPASNGMVERTNRTLKGLLKRMATQDYMTTWDAKLPLAQMAINSVTHSTTGFSPFRLQVAGNDEMRMPGELLFGRANSINYHCYYDYVHQLALAMQEISELVRRHTENRMAIQKGSNDRGPMRIRKYKIGDLCLRYYPPRASQKLHPFDWQGPYEVLDVDEDSRKVLLKDVPTRGGATRDTWIHVSALKPVLRTHCGKLLQQLDDGSWQELGLPEEEKSTSESDCSTANIIIPAIAGFSNPTLGEMMNIAIEDGWVYSR